MFGGGLTPSPMVSTALFPGGTQFMGEFPPGASVEKSLYTSKVI